MTDNPKTVTPWTIVKAVFAVFGLLAVLYAGLTFVDGRVEKKLEDPRLIRAIASKVRPTVIFDARGRILADMGAMEYLHDISVVNTNESPLPQKIIVSPRTHLANAPLLSPIDPSPAAGFTVDRGTKFDWVYTRSEDTVSWGIEGLVSKNVRFRIEIIP